MVNGESITDKYPLLAWHKGCNKLVLFQTLSTVHAHDEVLLRVWEWDRQQASLAARVVKWSLLQPVCHIFQRAVIHNSWGLSDITVITFSRSTFNSVAKYSKRWNTWLPVLIESVHVSSKLFVCMYSCVTIIVYVQQVWHTFTFHTFSSDYMNFIWGQLY